MKKNTLVFSLLLLSAAILVSTGLSVNNSEAAADNTIMVAYTSNLLAYMEPCG
jgi:hypothetical protein